MALLCSNRHRDNHVEIPWTVLPRPTIRIDGRLGTAFAKLPTQKILCSRPNTHHTSRIVLQETLPAPALSPNHALRDLSVGSPRMRNIGFPYLSRPYGMNPLPPPFPQDNKFPHRHDTLNPAPGECCTRNKYAHIRPHSPGRPVGTSSFVLARSLSRAPPAPEPNGLAQPSFIACHVRSVISPSYP